MTHSPLLEPTAPHADAYAERVASLFATRLPATLMSGIFILVGALISLRTGDGPSELLLALGAVVSGWRLWILYQGHRRCGFGLDRHDAVGLERRFGASYMSFAVLFGCFAAEALTLPVPSLHLPVAILVVGYAAGAVATTALRPCIAAGSVLVAVLPPALVLLTVPDSSYAVSSICLVALVAGSMRSLHRRHTAQVQQSATSSAFATLARRDHLTGLLNRFSLAEAIADREESSADATGYALHYLDLDGFKQINDHLGHAAGDAILCAVGRRLTDSAADGDVIARLGGDEFVVMQTNVRSPEAIAARAADIEQRLSDPFEVCGHAARVGASVGSSRRARSRGEMNVLLEEADAALRSRKLARKVPTSMSDWSAGAGAKSLRRDQTCASTTHQVTLATSSSAGDGARRSVDIDDAY